MADNDNIIKKSEINPDVSTQESGAEARIDDDLSTDAVEVIDSKKKLREIDESPLVGDYAKDYEDMPEDTMDKE